MPDGGRLTIAADLIDVDPARASQHADLVPGRYAELRVSDTGVGIEPEVQSRIFEPFFTSKTESGGTGLGLATVYGIVKQSGGQVWMRSTPDEGTTFTVLLPATAHRAVERETSEGTRARSNGGRETILLVEDNELVRELTKTILSKAGYTVLVADCPEAALTLCAEHRGEIGILLTDVVMPVMRGDELAVQIRAKRPDIRVLFMSGYTKDSRVDVTELCSFLEKPFRPGQLLDAVHDLVHAPSMTSSCSNIRSTNQAAFR